MSLDDIQFLKTHSFKQHYTFIIDSKDRNYIDNPHPNKYTINFTEPFKNVFGLEVIPSKIVNLVSTTCFGLKSIFVVSAKNNL